MLLWFSTGACWCARWHSFEFRCGGEVVVLGFRIRVRFEMEETLGSMRWWKITYSKFKMSRELLCCCVMQFLDTTFEEMGVSTSHRWSPLCLWMRSWFQVLYFFSVFWPHPHATFVQTCAKEHIRCFFYVMEGSEFPTFGDSRNRVCAVSRRGRQATTLEKIIFFFQKRKWNFFFLFFFSFQE